ncbi:MAG: hypothetical protein ABSC93_16585 [Bryobacteraceae bacterium]
MNNTWTNHSHVRARYAPIHDMVTKRLTETDPTGYTELLQDLRARYKPQGAESSVIECMADVLWLQRGCFPLENEILNRGMQASSDPKTALTKVWLHENRRGGLLSKLATYEDWLSREYDRYRRILELSAKNRKCKEARMADSLMQRKSCTSVIQ